MGHFDENWKSKAIFSNKLFFAFLIFCSFSPPSFAGVGENASEIEARYGKPIKDSEPLPPATQGKVYRRRAFQIIVYFFNEKSGSEIFSKKDSSSLTDAEILAALMENPSKSNWRKAKIVEGENLWDDRYWILEDSSVTAHYAPSDKVLIISTKEFMDGFKALHLPK